MVKIKNWNKKTSNIIGLSLCIVAIVVAFAIFATISAFLLFYGLIACSFEELVKGSLAIIFALIIFASALTVGIYSIILCCRSPKTIISDNEEIGISE